MFKFIPYTTVFKEGEDPHYDPRPVFSFGCKTIIIIGARSIGKTFIAKKYGVKRFKYKKIKFVWLRDNDEARKKIAQDNGARFFSDIIKKVNFCRDIEGKIEGSSIIINGETAGYLMPSSTFQNYKGNDFEEINTIIFDEFIAEKNRSRSANRAWEIINSLYTVGRTRNDIKIIMLANALDRSDPFLELLGVKIKEYGFYINREKDVVIHYADNNPEFNKAQQNSVVGKLIKGTIYEENLFNNKFTDDAQIYFDKRPPKCKLWCILHDSEKAVRLYVNENLCYASRDFNPESFINFRFVSNPKFVDTKHALASDWLYKQIKNLVANNVIKFENAFCRSTFYNFLDKK